jgi:hypothetical protein
MNIVYGRAGMNIVYGRAGMKIVYARIVANQIVVRVVPGVGDKPPKPIGNEPATVPVFSYVFPVQPPAGLAMDEYVLSLPEKVRVLLRTDMDAPHLPPEIPLVIEGRDLP